VTDQTEDDYCPPGEACIRPLLHRAFGLFWEHKGLLVGAHLIFFAVIILGDYLLRGIGGNVLLGPIILGLYKMNLAIVRNRETSIGDILSGFENFLPAFIVNIIIHLLFIINLSLLIIPGLLVLLTYALTYLFILEKDLGLWDAMEASRKRIWGANRKRWLRLGGVILGINLGGALFFLIGLAVTVPYSRLLITLAYDEEGERDRAEIPV